MSKTWTRHVKGQRREATIWYSKVDQRYHLKIDVNGRTWIRYQKTEVDPLLAMVRSALGIMERISI